MRILFFTVILVALVGGGVILDTRTIPAPQHTIEKVISNDRFFK
jgi:hypothetical protein